MAARVLIGRRSGKILRFRVQITLTSEAHWG
jgi:hypothetical protein